jgi:heme/copper-type cytochrome/quinol oxidase subunit 3
VGLAALLGVGFLVVQVIVWRQLFLAGLRPQTGAYASYFFALTVFHGLHVLVGLVALGWLALRPRRLPLRLWTIYWHMVGIIWGVMFLLVYVV